MDIEEMVAGLNKIQETAYTRKLDQWEKFQWRNLCHEIGKQGFILHRKTVANLYGREKAVLWSAQKESEKPRERHFEAEWVKFAPPRNAKNECTTRCFFYVFGETMSYNDIRQRQNELAREVFGQGRVHGWNNEKAYKILLHEHGFEKIVLPHKIRRDKLARLLTGCGRIVSKSSGHVAAIHDGKVYDSWNSMHGRCLWIYVENRFMEEAKRRLRA